MGNLIEKWFDFILKLQEKIFTNKTAIKIAKKQIEIENQIKKKIENEMNKNDFKQ